MNELLKIILSLSLSGLLLILVLLLFKPVIKNKLSKRWQYYIWLIVVARLLFPFAPETNLMGTLFQHFDTPALFSTDSVNQNRQSREAGGGYLESDKLPVPDILNMTAQNTGAICLLVWLIVAVSLFTRKVTVYQSFVKYMKAGRLEVSDLELWERVGTLIHQTGVKGTVGLYTNSLISSPLLVGFFRPCIMLPTTQLPDSDFQYTILHELIHYKRLDMFYKWLVQFTVCLHWFNPLVYFMSQEINRACELSCDEVIIQRLGNDGRRAYGDTLLNAMKAGGSYKDSLSSVTLSESKERLKERLDAIMNFKKKTHVTTTISVTLALVLCFGATASGAYIAAPQTSQMKETASDLAIIRLSSDGRGSITQSGGFDSKDDQILTLTAQSDIKGGMVDFFLFSPDGKEQRFTFKGSDRTETITLSTGTWTYNCTGFFTDGDIIISGELKNNDNKSTEPQNPDLTGETITSDSNVINLSSDGRDSITQSGGFDSKDDQMLILTAQSDIKGGMVDLFLFSPDGKEQRFTFNGSDKTETITLSAGTWAYNCTGFFTSGDISISGELKDY